MKFESTLTVFTASNQEKRSFSYTPNFEIKTSIDALKFFFELSFQMKETFYNTNGEESQYFALGKLSESSYEEFNFILSKINKELKMTLISPFEGCENIWGNFWRGKELLGRSEEDAIVQLRFEKKAMDLPSHVHSVSDRVLFVHSGSGFFHPNFDPYIQFSKSNMKSVPLESGNLLFFPKNFVHTFSTLNSEMEMFSYHLPFIELEDPLQYTITFKEWYPKNRING